MKKSVLNRALLASMSVLVLTVIHHVYGAVIYNSPFRLHIVFFVLPVMAVYFVVYSLIRRSPSKWYGTVSLWLFMILTLAIPVGMFGLIEGGYNHLMKNILYFGGATQPFLDRLFPPPTYEMPNDVWFEATGILQFFVGLYSAYRLLELWRNKSSAV